MEKKDFFRNLIIRNIYSLYQHIQEIEVHYEAVWVCAEVSTVLRTVALDFFFNCRCLEIFSLQYV
jgi:hypothetical protein